MQFSIQMTNALHFILALQRDELSRTLFKNYYTNRPSKSVVLNLLKDTERHSHRACIRRTLWGWKNEMLFFQ